jgi:hypothetical protein
MMLISGHSDDSVSMNSDNMETLLYCLINSYVYDQSCSSSCCSSFFMLDGWESSNL